MIRVWACESLSRLAVLCAAFAACGGAAAAGDGLGKARPRVDRCVAMYGPGFVSVEGTEACIKIGGHIRVDAGVSRHSRAPAPVWSGAGGLGRGISTSAGAEIDTRAETGVGTVRGVLRLRGGHASMPDPFR